MDNTDANCPSEMILSYIIPVYNGATSIARCLDSIYRSSLDISCFEIIIIDDCSKDNTTNVVEEYVRSYPNIRIIKHATNKRQGGAKNTGIRAARGKYIAFADQDDEVITENLPEVIRIAKDQTSDMISFSWIEQKGEKNRLCGINLPEECDFSGVTLCEKIFAAEKCLAPWSYLYRRDYLIEQGRPMAEKVLMEDSDWIAWHLVHAKKIHCIKMPIYKWIRHPNSITAGESYQHKADWVLFGLRKIEDANQYASISPKFASIMREDGRYNIEISLRTLWKADHYSKFYKKIGNNALSTLKTMKWSVLTKIIFHQPILVCFTLSIFGPILKTIKLIKNHAPLNNHPNV